jgi:hypothetical protein
LSERGKYSHGGRIVGLGFSAVKFFVEIFPTPDILCEKLPP